MRDEPRTDAEEGRTLRLILYDAIASEAKGTLTMGVFLLAAAVAPLLPTTAGAVTLILSLAIYQGMAAIGGCAWNSWMRDLVPASQFGRFFGRRTTATTAVSIVLALVGSALIDTWTKHVPDHAAAGYTILFVVSALIGFLGVYLLPITPDRPMAPVEKAAHPIALLSAPLRDPNFRRRLFFQSSSR